MSFQWLKMRITEEQERRIRESQIRERLPRAQDELQRALADCIANYTEAFGPESAELKVDGHRISVVVREQLDGEWQEQARVEIAILEAIPGFQIENRGESLVIEVGLLPGDKLFYRDRVQDQYVSLDEVTRRALDRVFFPKLPD
jgi:hypothetical protein